MQKIFDDQVIGKLQEDRSQLMNVGPSEWNIGIIDDNITSVDKLRARQKQILGGKFNSFVKLLNEGPCIFTKLI